MRNIQLLIQSGQFLVIGLTFLSLSSFAADALHCIPEAPSRMEDRQGAIARLKENAASITEFESLARACGDASESRSGLYRKSDVVAWVKAHGGEEILSADLPALATSVVLLGSGAVGEAQAFPAFQAQFLAAKAKYPGKEKFLEAVKKSILERLPESERANFVRSLSRRVCRS